MKSKSYALKAVKQFTKEIGVPYYIIDYPSKYQKSKELQHFLTKIGSTLRLLEEKKPWDNNAKLCIGIMKEPVKKDTK